MKKDIKYDLVSIMGPTATGKTSLAAHFALRINSEIISADSRQIYRDMNLGTGKDYEDYIINGQKINYHLIDIHPAGYKYNVFEYQKDFLNIYTQLKRQEILPVLCGGTGLYIDAVINAYKLLKVPINESRREELKKLSLEELAKILSKYKNLHNTSDTDTINRAVRAIEIEEYYQKHPKEKTNIPKINSLNICVYCDRDIRRERITNRLHARLKEGMIDEVKSLLDNGLLPDQLIYYGLEYKFITQYLTGNLSYNEMVSKLNIAIHQFAKRQMTWYRHLEKKGTKLHWLNSELPIEEKLDFIHQLLIR